MRTVFPLGKGTRSTHLNLLAQDAVLVNRCVRMKTRTRSMAIPGAPARVNWPGQPGGMPQGLPEGMASSAPRQTARRGPSRSSRSKARIIPAGRDGPRFRHCREGRRRSHSPSLLKNDRFERARLRGWKLARFHRALRPRSPRALRELGALRLSSELVAEVRVGDRDEGLGALTRAHPEQLGDAPLGDHRADMRASRDDPGALFQ